MESHPVYSPFPEFVCVCVGGGEDYCVATGLPEIPSAPSLLLTEKLSNGSCPTVRENYWCVSFLPSKPIHIFIT